MGNKWLSCKNKLFHHDAWELPFIPCWHYHHTSPLQSSSFESKWARSLVKLPKPPQKQTNQTKPPTKQKINTPKTKPNKKPSQDCHCNTYWGVWFVEGPSCVISSSQCTEFRCINNTLLQWILTNAYIDRWRIFWEVKYLFKVFQADCEIRYSMWSAVWGSSLDPLGKT